MATEIELAPDAISVATGGVLVGGPTALTSDDGDGSYIETGHDSDSDWHILLDFPAANVPAGAIIPRDYPNANYAGQPGFLYTYRYKIRSITAPYGDGADFTVRGYRNGGYQFYANNYRPVVPHGDPYTLVAHDWYPQAVGQGTWAVDEWIKAGTHQVGLSTSTSLGFKRATWFRLVIRFDLPGGRRGVPPLRLTQRSDGLTGGAPRLLGRKSRQNSNRLLGSHY